MAKLELKRVLMSPNGGNDNYHLVKLYVEKVGETGTKEVDFIIDSQITDTNINIENAANDLLVNSGDYIADDLTPKVWLTTE